MYDKLIIIGAGGHGKVVADIAQKMNIYNNISFLDNDESIKECMNYTVVGTCSDIEKYLDEADFFVAIGSSKIREQIMNELIQMGAQIATLIHPTACVGACVEIGKGSVVMSGAIINPGSVIGKGVIINTSASVDHDCLIKDYVHVSVGAHVCGVVSIGEHTWIGAGAVIRNCVTIISDCMIGLGAAVVKNIDEVGIYVGVPAKKRD